MQETELSSQITYSIGRLVMMGALSIILCMSVFMTILTPYPIGLSSVLFGRMKGITIAFVASVAFYFMIQSANQDFSVIGFYFLCMVTAIGLAEVVHRKINPIKGVLVMGACFIVLSGGLVYNYQQQRQMSFEDIILENMVILKSTFDQKALGAKRADVKNDGKVKGEASLEKYFKDPNIIAEAQLILRDGPSVIVIIIFLMLWVNMFLLLKSKRLFMQVGPDKYTEKTLLHFKMPEYFIFGVIFGFILTIWGEHLGSYVSEVGMFILKTLGVFYFFQGFGIYIAFLNYVKMNGFLRSILVILTVLTANHIIALVGVFDMFVNFRKYLKKDQIV